MLKMIFLINIIKEKPININERIKVSGMSKRINKLIKYKIFLPEVEIDTNINVNYETVNY